MRISDFIRLFTPKKRQREKGRRGIEVREAGPPLICSIELDRQGVFDMMAKGAMDRLPDDQKGNNWDASITVSSNGQIVGGRVNVYATEVKGRGHLWLVKE